MPRPGPGPSRVSVPVPADATRALTPTDPGSSGFSTPFRVIEPGDHGLDGRRRADTFGGGLPQPAASLGAVVIDIAFYEATAQVIPVFLLALLVQEVLAAPHLRDRDQEVTNNKVAAVMTGYALVAEALSLGVLAAQRDALWVAALTILGLGISVSVVILTHFSRLAFANLRLARGLGLVPLLLAAVAVMVVFWIDVRGNV